MARPFYDWSLTAANNSNADSTINWEEGMAPSAVNDSARAMMASAAAYRDDTSGSLTTGGTSTAYTLTTNQVFSSLTKLADQKLAFTVHATSGATPTLAVDGTAAKVIRNATGVALPTGALLAGSVYCVKYDTTVGEYLIVNQPGVLPTNSVATATIADDAVTYAKMTNISQYQVYGRYSSGSGDPQALTLSSGLTVDGSGNVTTSLNETLVPNYISGLTLSTAGGSAIFSIATGVASDSTNTALMSLGSAFTKTTSSWSVGTGNGALDTGAIANGTWYHVFLIKRSDTGVVDILISTSVSSPTMPASYDLKRRIGSIKTTSGSAVWQLFVQDGDLFLWDTMVSDVSTSTLGATATTYSLTTPPGVKTRALLRVGMSNASTSIYVLVSSPSESDQAASATTASISNPVAGVRASGEIQVLTDTSSQVRARANATSTTLSLSTYGWIDRRGK